MLLFTRRKVMVGAASLAAAIVIAGAGMFVGAGMASAAPIEAYTGTVESVGVTTESSPSNYTQATWTDVATKVVFMPSGPHGVVVRFSAESMCSGSGWCAARILVDNAEAQPVTGTDFAFDSPGDNWESHSMERVMQDVPASIPTIKVQVYMVNGATLRLDDWTLSVWTYDTSWS